MAIDSYPVGALLVLSAALLAVGGLFLVRRVMNRDTLRESHEVAGYLLSIVGTMYAVLLGLVVVDAMAKFQEARNNVQAEANGLADVFLLSERYTADKEKEIKNLCVHYARRVIDVEWKDMDDGNIDLEARRTAIKLMRAVQEFEPGNTRAAGCLPSHSPGSVPGLGLSARSHQRSAKRSAWRRVASAVHWGRCYYRLHLFLFVEEYAIASRHDIDGGCSHSSEYASCALVRLSVLGRSQGAFRCFSGRHESV